MHSYICLQLSSKDHAIKETGDDTDKIRQVETSGVNLKLHPLWV